MLDYYKAGRYWMKILLRYNLELFSFLMLLMMGFSLILIPELTVMHKYLLGYMFLYTLHEWEESRFPGGFSKLMAKFFGLELTKEKEELAHIPVAVLLIVITIVPFLVQNPVIVLVPVYLGIFEAVVHVVGIKLHKMSKPYTPGMVTALALLILSVCALVSFGKHNLINGSDYVLGVLCMFICFAAMQRTVITIFGLGYKDIFAKAKSKLKQ